MPENNPQPSKWSWSRLVSLLVLVSSLLAAVGGFFDFFHLDAPGWFLTVLAFIATLTERVQGGKSALIAGILTGDVTSVTSVDGGQSANIEAR